jgi:hypothetical protein
MSTSPLDPTSLEFLDDADVVVGSSAATLGALAHATHSAHVPAPGVPSPALAPDAHGPTPTSPPSEPGQRTLAIELSSGLGSAIVPGAGSSGTPTTFDAAPADTFVPGCCQQN